MMQHAFAQFNGGFIAAARANEYRNQLMPRRPWALSFSRGRSSSAHDFILILSLWFSRALRYAKTDKQKKGIMPWHNPLLIFCSYKLA